MDWLKQNPFLGGLTAVTAVLVAATGYFLWGAIGNYNAASATFTESKGALESLRAMKPFPNAENAEKAQTELEAARQTLAAIAKSVEITPVETTPIAFQDDLRKAANELKAAAEAAHVQLEENFFLGFNEYLAQPPPEAAAPKLALQLQSIQKIVSILIDERVEKIGPIVREPLSNNAKKTGGTNAAPEFALAPFNVNFTANQTAFHRAFNRILDITPPVFIRLVSIENSAQTSPSKAVEAVPAEQTESATKGDSLNKPIFGRETLKINLGLASIAAAGTRSEHK